MNIVAADISQKHMKNIIMQFMHWVLPRIQERLKRIRLEESVLHSLCGHLLLAYCLWHDYGLRYEQTEFFYGKYGKPYLKYTENIFFNISHSGNIAACAVGAKELGIDVEKICKINVHALSNCLSESEKEALDNIFDIQYFFRIWVLKESYGKFMGCGLNYPLPNISFHLTDEEIICSERKNLYFSEYTLTGYRMAVCSKEKPPEMFKLLTSEDLEKFFVKLYGSK